MSGGHPFIIAVYALAAPTFLINIEFRFFLFGEEVVHKLLRRFGLYLVLYILSGLLSDPDARRYADRRRYTVVCADAGTIKSVASANVQVSLSILEQYIELIGENYFTRSQYGM